jgi:hypothetical protein
MFPELLASFFPILGKFRFALRNKQISFLSSKICKGIQGIQFFVAACNSVVLRQHTPNHVVRDLPVILNLGWIVQEKSLLQSHPLMLFLPFAAAPSA